jgi:hypothetical protein
MGRKTCTFQVGGLVIAGILLSGAALGQSQSLGDVARANREKQQEEQASGAQPRVITNKDLPANPPGTPDSNAQAANAAAANQHPRPDRWAEQRQAARDQAMQRTGDVWRARIEAQQERIANLQARIDQLNSSNHAPGGNTQYQGPYQYQARQLQFAAMLQQQLEQQKRRLDAMQDAARRAGTSPNSFDP